jgi:hypothetical protein
MASLDFGDNDKETLIVVRGFCNRVNDTLFDNGKVGLVTTLNRFMTEQSTKEAEREKQHKANIVRLNIIIAILTLIAAYIGLVLTIKHPFSSTHASPDKVFHSLDTNPELSSTQSVHLPDMR